MVTLLIPRFWRDSSIPTVSHLGIGVTAGSASALLNVEGTAVASSADGVSLGVSLTKRSGTLGLRGGESTFPQLITHSETLGVKPNDE